MRPQEMGQREASGRKDVRRMPSSFGEGLSWGRLGSPAAGPLPPHPRLPCQPSVNALSLQTKVQGPCALGQAGPLSNRKPAVNEGGLVSPCVWGRSLQWESPGRGSGRKDAGQPQRPGPGWGWEAARGLGRT